MDGYAVRAPTDSETQPRSRRTRSPAARGRRNRRRAAFGRRGAARRGGAHLHRRCCPRAPTPSSSKRTRARPAIACDWSASCRAPPAKTAAAPAWTSRKARCGIRAGRRLTRPRCRPGGGHERALALPVRRKPARAPFWRPATSSVMPARSRRRPGQIVVLQQFRLGFPSSRPRRRAMIWARSPDDGVRRRRCARRRAGPARHLRRRLGRRT